MKRIKLFILLSLIVTNCGGGVETIGSANENGPTALIFPGLIQDKISNEMTNDGIFKGSVLESIPIFHAEAAPLFQVGGFSLQVANYYEDRPSDKSLYYYADRTMEIIQEKAKPGDALMFHSNMVLVAKYLMTTGRLDPSKYKFVFIEGPNKGVPLVADWLSGFDTSWESVQDMQPGSKFLKEIDIEKIEEYARTYNFLEIQGQLSESTWYVKYLWPIGGVDIFARTLGAVHVDFPDVKHVQLLRNRAVIQTVIAYLKDPYSFSNLF